MNKYQEDDIVVIETSVSNAYGTVCFVKQGESYYMTLDNETIEYYGGGSTIRISKEMFEAAKKIDWSKDE